MSKKISLTNLFLDFDWHDDTGMQRLFVKFGEPAAARYFRIASKIGRDGGAVHKSDIPLLANAIRCTEDAIQEFLEFAMTDDVCVFYQTAEGYIRSHRIDSDIEGVKQKRLDFCERQKRHREKMKNGAGVTDMSQNVTSDSPPPESDSELNKNKNRTDQEKEKEGVTGFVNLTDPETNTVYRVRRKA